MGPDFEFEDGERKELVDEFEYASRGITSVDFPAGEDVTRVMVSSFDTFTLGSDPRQSNPSGAAALRLDDREFEDEDGETLVINTVQFPVNWDQFTEGIVEDAFGPVLEEGDQ